MGVDSQRIAKNTLVMYFRMFISMAISLCTAGVTLRVLGEVDYGISCVLGGIVAMFSFLNGSLSGAASRNITFELGRGDADALNKVFNVSLIVHAVLSVIIVLLCETVGLWFFYNKMVIPPERMRAAFWVLQISILTCPLSLTQVPYGAVLIAHENMKVFAYVDIVNQGVRLLGIYTLLVSPYDKLVTLSVFWWVWSVITMAFYRIYCYRKYPETHLRFCSEKGVYKRIMQFAGADLIGNIAGMLQGQGLNLLANTFFGPAVNAARGIAYHVQGTVSQFSGGFLTALKPQVIKTYAAGDEKSMWKLVEGGSCLAFYLLFIIVLPVALEAETLLTLWLGKIPAHTVAFLRLIFIICLITTLHNPRGTVFQATGKILLVNVVVGLVLCAVFPVSYVWLRLGGAPESVYLVMIASWMSAEILDVVILRRYLEFSAVKYFMKVYGRCFSVAAISTAICFCVYDWVPWSGIYRVISSSFLTTVVIGGLGYGIGLDVEWKMQAREFAFGKCKKLLDAVRGGSGR